MDDPCWLCGEPIEPLDPVKQAVSEALVALEPLFTEDCKLTFVMRSTTNEECYLVLSKDDLSEVAKTIARAKEADRA